MVVRARAATGMCCVRSYHMTHMATSPCLDRWRTPPVLWRVQPPFPFCRILACFVQFVGPETRLSWCTMLEEEQRACVEGIGVPDCPAACDKTAAIRQSAQPERQTATVKGSAPMQCALDELTALKQCGRTQAAGAKCLWRRAMSQARPADAWRRLRPSSTPSRSCTSVSRRFAVGGSRRRSRYLKLAPPVPCIPLDRRTWPLACEPRWRRPARTQ